jgi:protein SCO1/2
MTIVHGVLRTLLAALLIPCFSFAVCARTQRAEPASHAGIANFTLIDQFGRRFALADYVGHPLVLFFGYSHCGDVCPLTLEKLEHAKSALGVDATPLQVVFITVDPQRDTPEVLRRYIATFDPTFIALTGSRDRLAGVYAAYHVSHHALAPRDGSHDYEVEHSSLLYYIGRDGRFRGFGDWTDSQTIVTESVRDLLSAPRSAAALK